MSEPFKQYKRKLRWKSTIRKHGMADPLQEQFDIPAASNPQDPYFQGRHGPWRSEWNGGRLMDIYHDEADTPLDAIEAGHYDWENAGPFSGAAWHEPPTQEGVNQRLKQWADEYGDDYIRNQLPYQSNVRRKANGAQPPSQFMRKQGSDGFDYAYPVQGTPWCPICHGLGKHYDDPGRQEAYHQWAAWSDAGHQGEAPPVPEPPVCPGCGGSGIEAQPDLGFLPETSHPAGAE